MEPHWIGTTRWAAVGTCEETGLGAVELPRSVGEGRGEPKRQVELREAEPSARSGSRLSRRARRSVLLAYDAGWKVPRRVNRKLSATDGPFAETKEGLGGSFLRTQDAAIEVAPKIPPVRPGKIEVRPMIAIEMHGLARTARLLAC